MTTIIICVIILAIIIVIIISFLQGFRAGLPIKSARYSYRGQ